MKTLKLLIPCLMLAIGAMAQLPSDEFFERYVLKTTAATKPGYGMSAENPIKLGVYEDMTNQAKMSSIMGRFTNTFTWPDGSRVQFLSRKTVMINSVNYDKFFAVKPGTTDTIALFVDMYNPGELGVPECFKAFTKEKLAAEFTPTVTELRKFFTLGDKYADTTAKRVSIQLLSSLQTSVGIDYLLDKDYLDAILNNFGLDMDLKAYLMRSYMFHKFDAVLSGQPDAKVKAFNAMVDDFTDVTKRHPDLSTGGVAALMVKKS